MRTFILRVLSALLCPALTAAIVVPSQWALKNRPWYDYIYPAVLWGCMLFFANWPGTLKRPRSDRTFIAVVLLIFLVSRLAWILLVPTLPVSDFEGYHTWAIRLSAFQPIHGDLFRLSIQFALQPWLYPLSLAIFYDIFGQHLIVAKLENVVAGALSIWLVYKLANQLFGTQVARLSAILFLLWPTQLIFTSTLAAEHLAVVLGLWAFVYLVEVLGEEKANYRSLILGGLLLGLSFVTRYPIGLAVPCFILALALTRRSFKLKVKQGTVFAGTFLLTFLLYLGFVAAIYRQVYLPDSGLQLLEGTNLTTGGMFTIDDTHLFEANETLAEANEYARAEALRRIKSQPRNFVVLMGNKIVVYWRDDFYGPLYSTEAMTPGRVSSFLAVNDRSLLAISQFFLLTVLFAAVLGLVYILLGGGDARLILILSLILGGTLMHSILVVHSRYHYPSGPLIIILAAFGLMSLMSITIPGFAQRMKLKRSGVNDGQAMANAYGAPDGTDPDSTTPKDLDPQPSNRANWRKPALVAIVGSGLLAVLLFGIFGGSYLPNRGPIVRTAPKGPSGGTKATIALDSNPVKVCDGSALGTAAVSYTFPPGTVVEVRIDSPNGPLFARPATSGTSTTGKWVTDGMIFFLQDVTGGKALIEENTLATVLASLTTEGCQ